MPSLARAHPGTFGSRPAYYEGSEGALYFLHGNVSVERIRHEFGHHIEEQGPVEIWRGLASLRTNGVTWPGTGARSRRIMLPGG